MGAFAVFRTIFSLAFCLEINKKKLSFVVQKMGEMHKTDLLNKLLPIFLCCKCCCDAHVSQPG
jgi:hypothetical protein